MSHHVGQLGIDCRYCHTSVETSAFAGIPTNPKLVLNCHQEIWVGSAGIGTGPKPAIKTANRFLGSEFNKFAPIRLLQSQHSRQQRRRCTECHGRVDLMPFTYQDKSLLMGWCLDCHRNPKEHLRPRDEIFNINWQPPADRAALADELYTQYEIRSTDQLTSCSTCHR